MKLKRLAAIAFSMVYFCSNILTSPAQEQEDICIYDETTQVSRFISNDNVTGEKKVIEERDVLTDVAAIQAAKRNYQLYFAEEHGFFLDEASKVITENNLIKQIETRGMSEFSKAPDFDITKSKILSVIANSEIAFFIDGHTIYRYFFGDGTLSVCKLLRWYHLV